MPTYKLTYFNIRGLAEPIRFLLSYGDVDFVDERLDYNKDWEKVKHTMPFGQVPVLEVDGKKIPQSMAICRYLAKQFGLAGQNDWEALEIDATIDTIQDFRVKIAAHFYEKEPERKTQKLNEAKEAATYYISKFDEKVKRNGGYFVGGKLSWADLVFVAYLDSFIHTLESNIIENAENLKALRAKVLALPKINAWVSKRPKTN